MKHGYSFFLTIFLAASGVAAEAPYCKSEPVAIVSEVDRLLAADWERRELAMPREASDTVLVRRLYLGLTGRLPTGAEARSYVESSVPEKRRKLIDQLLASDGFIDYWTMRWCDALRVKSEFPINLWPNAVYGYERRIRAFVKENEPFDRFARALLTSGGSNFRVPEVNFYRAVADRGPDDLTGAVTRTFLGTPPEKFPEETRLLWTLFLRRVAFKPTREWKEEIVYFAPADSVAGSASAFADAVIAHPDFARALVNRVWYWFFGRGLVPEADDLHHGAPVNPELLEQLAAAVVRSNYDFRELCRVIADSAAGRAAPFAKGDPVLAEMHFAAWPIRRLDAEVLDDAIRDLAGAPGAYSSVIPEPFSYLPPEARTVTLADGSISTSFLILFGRPARDSGLFSERSNRINAKQRLYLFNSGELYRRVGRIPQRDEWKKLPFLRKVEALYWAFYSRPPTREESRMILETFERLPRGPERGRFQQDLCWILLNSKEFLYQH